MRSELEAHRCVCVGVLAVFGAHPYERGMMPHLFRATSHLFGAMLDANGDARSVVGIASLLNAFPAMRSEGDDAVHEESHRHHALHGVPDPSRKRGSECLGRCSQRQTAGPAYVGLPRCPRAAKAARVS